MVWFLLLAVPIALLGLVTVVAALVASQTDRSPSRPATTCQGGATARVRGPEPDFRGL